MHLLDESFLDLIDFTSILEIERSTLSKINDETKKDYLWQRLEELLYHDFNIPQGESADMLAFRSLDRDDYKRLFDTILQSTDAPIIRAESYRELRRVANPEAANFVHESTILMKYIDEPNSILRSCLYVHLCQHFWIVTKIFSNSFKRLLLFGDMQSVENLAAQIARIKGIRSATIQHGLYVDYGSYKTINVVNYLNHNSDYFLAWGAETKALIERYRPDANVIICGNPVLSKSSIAEGSQKNDYILVVLDQFIFQEQNLAMLQVVSDYGSKLGISVAVRCHPTDNKEVYFTKIPGLIEGGELESAKFVVGHTTTLLFEMLAKGVPALQYVTEIPRINLPASLQFDSAETLREINLNGLDVSEVSQHYFGCLGDDASARYAHFFDDVF